MIPFLQGDVNRDGKVDIMDLSIIVLSLGIRYRDPNWTPSVARLDMDEDGDIDMTDLSIASANYGKTWRTYWGE